MQWKDHKAVLAVDDHDLEEHDVKRDDQTTSGWIASEEGKPFTIKLTNTSPSAALYDVYIDGRLMDRAIVRSGRERVVHGTHVASALIRPFIFARINISDDDALLDQDIKNLEAIGTIRIVVRRVTVDENSQRPMKGASGYDTDDIGLVHERRKKAGVHCVSLGKEIQAQQARTVIDVDYHDTLENPHCVFVFRYRSRDFLQAQGIITLSKPVLPQTRTASADNGQAQVGGSGPSTRPSGPVAGSSKRPRGESSPQTPEVKEESDDSEVEDAEAIQAQLQALQARLSKAQGKSARKRMKREPSPIVMQTSGDIIDLTSD